MVMLGVLEYQDVHACIILQSSVSHTAACGIFHTPTVFPSSKSFDAIMSKSHVCSPQQAGILESMVSGISSIKIELPPPARFSTFCLPEAQIDPEMKPRIFGAKSTNIVKVSHLRKDVLHKHTGCPRAHAHEVAHRMQRHGWVHHL